MDATDLVVRLEAVEPLRLQAVDLILRLEREVVTDYDAAQDHAAIALAIAA